MTNKKVVKTLNADYVSMIKHYDKWFKKKHPDVDQSKDGVLKAHCYEAFVEGFCFVMLIRAQKQMQMKDKK